MEFNKKRSFKLSVAKKNRKDNHKEKPVASKSTWIYYLSNGGNVMSITQMTAIDRWN